MTILTLGRAIAIAALCVTTPAMAQDAPLSVGLPSPSPAIVPTDASRANASAIVAPTAQALLLAHAISGSMDTTALIARYQRSIRDQLLSTIAAWRGAPCDPTLAECRNAAEALAREVAPLTVARVQASSARLSAIYFDAVMSEQEIADATRIVATPSGRALAQALLSLSNPHDWPVGVSERVMLANALEPSSRPAGAELTLTDRFYDMTAELPRAVSPQVPSPPRHP